MSEHGAVLEKTNPIPTALTSDEVDVRALVRLIQCPQCSRPFRSPVTLPCGNSLCRECLPQPHPREHISYPDLPGRREAVQCPFPDCGLDHPTSDCNTDVTLAKVMEVVAGTIPKINSLDENTSSVTVTSATTVTPWNEDGELSEKHALPESFPNSRLTAAYWLAVRGELDRTVDRIYQNTVVEDRVIRAQDDRLLQDLTNSINKEVDCHVCYSLILDPVTTFCGHTLCRNCLLRVLDYSLHCPVCRRGVATDRSLSEQSSNQVIVALLNRCWPDQVAARAEAVAMEEQSGRGPSTAPLFVCTLAFPGQPTFLRIFEPRYKLMIRRCLEGNRRFGMLMYNRYSIPQGEMGSVPFYHYGTMLEIVQAQPSPNGESVIETRGVYRFRVKSHAVQDGYLVGEVERLDDVSLAEEERIESEETSVPPPDAPEYETVEDQINRMSTQSLLELGHAFIERMHGRAAWLQHRFLDIYGQEPRDPVDFPYWFASMLPIHEEEKYKLLGTRTVRERLKITAGWIRRIESQRWYQNPACRIL